MRTRLLLVGVGLVLGVVLTAGAVWANGFRTHLDSQGMSGGYTPTNIKAEKDYAAVIATVCVEGGGDVTVTGVRPGRRYGDIDVLDFTVEPFTNSGEGVQRADSRRFEEDASSPSFGVACDDSQWDARNVVVKVRAHELPAAIEGFLVDYKVRGITKTVTSDVFVMLCHGDETDEDDEMFRSADGEDPFSTCREWIEM